MGSQSCMKPGFLASKGMSDLLTTKIPGCFFCLFVCCPHLIKTSIPLFNLLRTCLTEIWKQSCTLYSGVENVTRGNKIRFFVWNILFDSTFFHLEPGIWDPSALLSQRAGFWLDLIHILLMLCWFCWEYDSEYPLGDHGIDLQQQSLGQIDVGNLLWDLDLSKSCELPLSTNQPPEFRYRQDASYLLLRAERWELGHTVASPLVWVLWWPRGWGASHARSSVHM